MGRYMHRVIPPRVFGDDALSRTDTRQRFGSVLWRVSLEVSSCVSRLAGWSVEHGAWNTERRKHEKSPCWVIKLSKQNPAFPANYYAVGGNKSAAVGFSRIPSAHHGLIRPWWWWMTPPVTRRPTKNLPLTSAVPVLKFRCSFSSAVVNSSIPIHLKITVHTVPARSS